MASDGANIDHGVLVRQWKWPLRIAFWWATIGVLVWAFTLTVHWYWARSSAPEAQLPYAQAVLDQELAALSELRPGAFEPIEVAAWIRDSVHDIAVSTALLFSRALMNWTGFMRTNAASETQRANPDPGGDFVRRQLADAGDGWLLLVTNTGLFAVRTTTYLCSLPLLALGILLGVTDGLVARAKRKACAGHESASLYHRAKLAWSFVAILGYVMYLATPSVAQPVRFLLPLVLLLVLLLRLQCAYYKKYL